MAKKKIRKSECFQCSCGSNQISYDLSGFDLFAYNKKKPDGKQWESFVCFDFICMSCDKEWSVKCKVTPLEIIA